MGRKHRNLKVLKQSWAVIYLNKWMKTVMLWPKVTIKKKIGFCENVHWDNINCTIQPYYIHRQIETKKLFIFLLWPWKNFYLTYLQRHISFLETKIVDSCVISSTCLNQAQQTKLFRYIGVGGPYYKNLVHWKPD